MNKWGYLNKTKWALIDEAPLTGSGLNEILACTVTKKQAVAMAGFMGIKLTGKGSIFHSVVKLEDLQDELDELERGD